MGSPTPTRKEGDGFVSRYLNRRLSFPITRVLLRVAPNISPNTVSFVSFIIGIVGALLFSMEIGVLGGIAVQLSSVLDGCDGEIARIKGRSSRFGAFFDSILDRYVDSLVIMGLVVYCFKSLNGHRIFDLVRINELLILVVSVFTLIGTFQVSYSAAKGQVNFARDFSRTLQGRDFRLFVIFLSGLVSPLDASFIFLVLLILAALTNVSVVWRMVVASDWEKQTRETRRKKIK
ncbi:MAG: CDP-alcohol phosphatidyltransferase family protein [Candidatus Heimdallarchaeota archaeon]